MDEFPFELDRDLEENAEKNREEVAWFLQELETYPWFAEVGEPLNDPEIRQVDSWAEAWECLQDDAWSYASFHHTIDPRHPLWVRAYDLVYAIVSASTRSYELEPDDPVARSAAWDAGGAAFQLATGADDGFYVRLMDWYRRGHWPCGWEGRYPEGRLIVF